MIIDILNTLNAASADNNIFRVRVAYDNALQAVNVWIHQLNMLVMKGISSDNNNTDYVTPLVAYLFQRETKAYNNCLKAMKIWTREKFNLFNL